MVTSCLAHLRDCQFQSAEIRARAKTEQQSRRKSSGEMARQGRARAESKNTHGEKQQHQRTSDRRSCHVHMASVDSPRVLRGQAYEARSRVKHQYDKALSSLSEVTTLLFAYAGTIEHRNHVQANHQKYQESLNDRLESQLSSICGLPTVNHITGYGEHSGQRKLPRERRRSLKPPFVKTSFCEEQTP